MDGPGLDPTVLMQHMQALYEYSDLLVALFDENDVLRYANPAFRSAYLVEAGASPTWSDLMRTNHASGKGAVIDTDDLDAWLASAASRRGKRVNRVFDVDFHGGRWVRANETQQPGGCLLFVGTDITGLRNNNAEALREAHFKAWRAACTDHLTGLSSRAHVLEQLGEMLGRPDAEPVCVAVLDLDHFKRINDRFGHAGGDRVLLDFARLLQAGIRREDACGRLGGEEFLIVLPGTPLAHARTLCERLLSTCRASQPFAEMADFHYSCSIGLAQAEPGESVDHLLLRADAALYAAKADGRDTVCVAGSLDVVTSHAERVSGVLARRPHSRPPTSPEPY